TEGLQLFGGDWTERKLEALFKYLKAYVKVLSRTPFATVYIDAFAGTGYRERIIKPIVDYGSVFEEDEAPNEPEPQRFLDGSARIALKIVPPFQKYIFIELDSRRAAELEKLKEAFPAQAASIEVR